MNAGKLLVEDESMTSHPGRIRKIATHGALAALLVLGIARTGIMARATQISSAATTNTKEGHTVTTQSSSQNKFYCNIGALTAAERAHHKELTEKLLSARKETVETPGGYEFQFNPRTVTLAEMADWVSAESKCCSFLDFHIDVEADGNLLCLRLTGETGVKAFIRAEFGLKNG
jgi:hypothetical protein